MNETSVCRTAWCRAVLSMLNANYDAVREGHGTMGIDRDSAAAWWMDQVTFEFLQHDFKKKVFDGRGINKRGRCGTCVRSSVQTGFFALAADFATTNRTTTSDQSCTTRGTRYR